MNTPVAGHMVLKKVLLWTKGPKGSGKFIKSSIQPDNYPWCHFKKRLAKIDLFCMPMMTIKYLLLLTALNDEYPPRSLRHVSET